MKKLLLLCGGQSPEHKISIRSCKNILNAIDRSRFSVTLIGIDMQGQWYLLQESHLGDHVDGQGATVDIRPGRRDCFWSNNQSLGVFDAVFPILHGPNGEDGSIQGLLKLLGLAFVGPGVLASSVAMDKDATKRILRDTAIKVADWVVIRKGDAIPTYSEIKNKLGEILFVKPSNMGSSVGVHRVDSPHSWEEAVADALRYDVKVLVERAISGRELECAVLGNEEPKTTGVGEVKSGGFYSFDEKYASSSEAQIIIPAQVSESELKKLKHTAIQAYNALGCEGLSRVDMFLTAEGDTYVNEVNTIPGFTSISMYPKLWEQEGMSYAGLIEELIALAIERNIQIGQLHQR